VALDHYWWLWFTIAGSGSLGWLWLIPVFSTTGLQIEISFKSQLCIYQNLNNIYY